MKRRYTLLDIFSGGGGFSRGFHDAGFHIKLAIDNYPPAARTYKLNFPQAYLVADDVKEVDRLLLSSMIDVDDIDVVIASPPCEPFTGANPERKRNPLDRLYDDPAGQLFLHAIRLIGEVKPLVFVIENVPGILEQSIKTAIKRELKRVGYDNVYFNILKAEEHGTPSSRTRVFVSNLRLDPAKKRGVTVEEALNVLPEPGASYPPNHEYPPDVPRRHRRRLHWLKWGESLIKYTGAGGRMLPNYTRLHPHRIAPTVMGTSRFIHPYEDRLLTVREQARLMGFPDHHIFLGSRDAQYDMVGEAVPPPLANAIAEYILRVLPEIG